MAEASGVLLVEDSESDVFFFRRAMKKVGADFPLQIASDGPAAIDYLSGVSSLPLLVLLDLKIPKRSGFEVLEWIRSDLRLRNLRVMFLTSSAERADIRRAYDLGAILFIAKPLGLAPLGTLIRALASYLDNPDIGPQPDLVAFSLPRPLSLA
jgi:CheY-like chemotaxis protein